MAKRLRKRSSKPGISEDSHVGRQHNGLGNLVQRMEARSGFLAVLGANSIPSGKG